MIKNSVDSDTVFLLLHIKLGYLGISSKLSFTDEELEKWKFVQNTLNT